jgi:hypothetical protein
LEFVSLFFRALGKALSINLHYTSGYHPEANRGTEHLNQTLESYLQIYCSYQHNNWRKLLPLAEFAYNNSPHTSTGVLPFFANKAYHPLWNINPAVHITSSRAKHLISNITKVQAAMVEHLQHVQQYYKAYANAHQMEAPDFANGSMVFVNSKFFRTTRPLKKLSDRYIVPYHVIKHVNPASVMVELPHTMKQVHLVFHVSMLKPYKPDPIPDQNPDPPLPVEMEDNVEYKVAHVVDSKLDLWLKNPLMHLIEWKGYKDLPDNDRYQWMQANQLEGSVDVIADFHKEHPNKPGPKQVAEAIARKEAAKINCKPVKGEGKASRAQP